MRGIQMKRTLIRLGLTALISSALFGCGGGSDGVSGSNSVVQISPSTPASSILSNAATPSSASVQAWRALEPRITVTGVTINSPPVVSFAVTDATGAAVVGLGNQSQASTARLKSLTNLSFTLAKLVPGATASEPSKWVSYLVTKPTTVAQAAGTVASTESCTADLKWCGTYPTTDKEGTLVDNGDGTYKYTFARDVRLAKSIVDSLPNSADGLKLKADLGDLTYDPSLTHRVGIIISGAAPGTGSNVPNATQVIPGTNIAIAGNLVYDFRPDGGIVSSTRNVVDISSCASCHNGKGLAHGGSRKDPNLCVTCHTDQVKYGMSAEATRASALVLNGTTQNTTSVLDGRAIGNYPNLIHKFHMGDRLSLKGYNYIPNGSGVGVQFEKDEWIQDPRNCTKCHNGADKTDINQATKTKDGDNWKTKPSRLACGACHDDVSFTPTPAEVTAGVTASGLVAHPGGAATDDSTCASCHAVGGAAVAPIDVAHRTEVPTANNPVPITGISTISYEIKSVTVDSTTKQPKITFRIIKDGAPVTSFATPTPTQSSAGVYSVPSTFEPIPGFRSGPSFYVAFAVPQDGIASPADFNTYVSVSLTNLLVTSGHPKAGTLAPASNATDAANGYLTATLTGSAGQVVTTSPTTPIACPQVATTATGYCASPSLIKIPSTAKMVTGAMIGTFTQVAFTSGDTAKLTAQYNPTTGTLSKGLVIKTNLQKLVATGYTARRVVVENAKCDSCHEQLGTAVEFHGGARNDPTACAICHNTSRTSSGWSANASTFIHGIHAGTDPVSVASILARSNLAGCVAPPATAQTCYPDGVPGTGTGGAGLAYGSGKRTVPFSWHRDQVPTVAGGFNAAAVVLPGILRNCENCHVPNAVNFGASGSTLLPNLLWSTSGTGTYSATDNFKVYPRDPVTGAIKYIATGVNYGNVFSFIPEGSVISKITTSTGGTNADALTIAGVNGALIAADTATLVESPITAACFACHDSSTAKSHFNQYGGVFYSPRSANGGSTLVNNETCLICHGMGRDQDVAAVHAKK
jgi:OmcA/MtrC family decaheme c-type cytochrome